MAYLYLHFAMGMQSTAEVFGTSQRKSMIWGAKMRWKSKLSSSSLLNWLLPIWNIYTRSWNMIILFGIHKWSGYMQFFWFKKNKKKILGIKNWAKFSYLCTILWYLWWQLYKVCSIGKYVFFSIQTTTCIRKKKEDCICY